MIYLYFLGIGALIGGSNLVLTAKRTAGLVGGYALVALGGLLIGIAVSP